MIRRVECEGEVYVSVTDLREMCDVISKRYWECSLPVAALMIETVGDAFQKVFCEET